MNYKKNGELRKDSDTLNMLSVAMIKTIAFKSDIMKVNEPKEAKERVIPKSTGHRHCLKISKSSFVTKTRNEDTIIPTCLKSTWAVDDSTLINKEKKLNKLASTTSLPNLGKKCYDERVSETKSY